MHKAIILQSFCFEVIRVHQGSLEVTRGPNIYSISNFYCLGYQLSFDINKVIVLKFSFLGLLGVISSHQRSLGDQVQYSLIFLYYLGNYLSFDIHKDKVLLRFNFEVIKGHQGSKEVTRGSKMYSISVFRLPGLLAFI